MSTVFELPELGENVETADILKVLVSEGDEVDENQPVLEVESDKATVEVPSSVQGKVSKIFVSAGDAIQVGDRVLEVEAADASDSDEADASASASEQDEGEAVDAAGDGEARDEDAQEHEREVRARDSTSESKSKSTPKAAREAPKERAEADDDSAPEPRGRGGPRRPVFAAPSVRRVARERGVDLEAVDGSGPEGRITVDDVEAHAEAGAEREAPSKEREAPSKEREAPRGDTQAAEPGARTEKLSGIRKTIARRMTEAWQTIPHVTLHTRPSARGVQDALEGYRKLAGEDGPKITMTAVLLKLAAATLRRHRRLNAHFGEDGASLERFDAVHLGVAVDTEAGLLVPVVRDADRKSVRELAEDLTRLAEAAREGSLKGEQMKGATFTVTNLGGLGVEEFTPIIDPPQVGVLGVGALKGTGGEDPRLTLSLSFDHRAVDGADGARFLASFGALCADANRIAFET